jgi:trans-aconitate methyltransferase
MFTSRENFIQYVTNYRALPAKDTFIVDACRGKTVLDLGCIDHSAETALALGERWLHRQIKAVANDLVGVDILKEDVHKLNQLGYQITASDISDLDLRRQFDVIIAGDLIEHVSNIGHFLDIVEKHMHEKSVCIVTTPNPFNIEQTMLAIFQNQIAVNSQHTCWLDPRVMYELVSRSRLSITDFHWVDTRFNFPVQRKRWKTVTNRLTSYLMRKRPILRRDYAVVLSKKQELRE